MRDNELIALTLLELAIPLGILLACVSQRVRALFFFGMVFGSALTYRLQINFLTHYWYHGTTRGIEFSFVNILALAVLGSSLLAPRPGQPRFFWPASLSLMLIFFAYACASVGFSEPSLYGVFELSKMVRGMLVFLAAALFVQNERDLKVLVLALACSACMQGIFAVEQRWLKYVDRVPGTLDHPNSLSMYLCMIGPVLVAGAASNFPRYVKAFSILTIGFAAVALMLTVSRAGVPIFAAIMLGTTLMCISWRITLKKVAGAALLVLFSGGLLASMWDNLKERYGEATLHDEYFDQQIEGRGYYLRLAKVIVGDRFFGVGLNNWSYWVSKKYGQLVGRAYNDYDDLHVLPPDDKTIEDMVCAAPAHNLAALTVGELGIPGLCLFALLWGRWFQMGLTFLRRRVPDAMIRMGVGIFFGLCGLFLQSITEWTFRQTHIFLTFNALLGVLAGLRRIKRARQRQTVAVAATAPGFPWPEHARIAAAQPCA